MTFQKFLVFLFCLFTVCGVSAQEFSNKGTEFWLGYGYHESMAEDNNQDMVLYFTSDQAATVKVEIPALGWVKTYQVAANQVTESDPMPKGPGNDARLLSEGKYNTGIHITSDKPIVAYTHNYNLSVSGASLLFPVATLGQDYYSLNFTQKSNTNASNSWAFVVATEDNTVVEIIPSAQTLTHAAGASFSVTLNKGEIYNVMGVTNNRGPNVQSEGVDLTGTIIRSVSNGTSGCKKIAVFSGSGRIYINCNSNDDDISSDNLIQQVFPRVAWGKKYLTVPTEKLKNNYFRIIVSDPATVVTINGSRATGLQSNIYYEFSANTPQSIVSDKPIMVAQYITSSQSCNNSPDGTGDPEMIYLSPIEQVLNQVTLNSTSHYDIKSHYINVVLKSAAASSFTLDGTKVLTSFVQHPADPTYSYAVLSVGKGVHTLKADSGFNAIAYGYGIKESYGYNAGTNIKNLNQFLTIQNQYASPDLPTACKNRNFNFLITLPFKPSSLVWDFANNPNLSPSATVTDASPKIDSTFTRDGQAYYVYKLKTLYSYSALGAFLVKVTANNQTSDGCNGIQEMTYNVQVVEPPLTDFSFTHAGCLTDSVYFKDASIGNGQKLVKWLWDFGDQTKDSVPNPHKGFKNAGTYNIKYTSINDIGCATDTIKPFTIAPYPIAKFVFSAAPTCERSKITFTDQSSISSGKIVKWYWDFGDGGTLVNTTNATVAKTFNAPGSYTVTLQVENESGCKSQVYKQTIAVNTSPVVNFSMPGACLPSADARFTNLSTINDGTAATLTYLWNFGDGQSSTLKDPQHTYTTAGPFSVNLKVTSANGCSKDSTIVFSNIYPKPTPGFSFIPATICVSDSIHFTDTSSAKNSSVAEWYWNFGDGKIETIKNPTHKFADGGSYTISLAVKSAFGCISDTLKKTINVNKSPTAAFTISGSTCQDQPFTITDQSKANAGVITNWRWSFSDGTTENHSNSQPFTKSSATAGNYVVSLVVVTNNGCKSDTVKQTAVVAPLPVANCILPKVCANDPFAAFTDSSYMPGNVSGSPFTFSWNFGDASSTAANPNTSTTQNPRHKFAIAGTYTISLTVTSGAGCAASVTKSLTVNGGSPQADFSLVNNGAICSNTKISVKNNSSVDIGSINKIQIIWDSQNSPATVQTDDTPFKGKVYDHTFAATSTAKTYQVKMIAYSGATCYGEKTLSVTVNPSPSVTFSAVPDICLNDLARTITQAKETTGLQGNAAFFGKGVTQDGVFNPSIAGAGTATLKYVFTSSAGCKDSATQIVEVIQNPIVKLNSPVYVLEGGSADLNPTIIGNAVKFLWTPPTYLSNPNIRNPQSVPKDSITYKLTAATQSGCEGSGQVRVLILKSLGIPNAFSPNGDGINDFWVIPSLASYPNCTVQVFNRFGTVVYNSVGYSKPWDGTFNGSNLPVGVYYYIVNPKNGKQPYTGYVTILK